jgi:hypothetical protein
LEDEVQRQSVIACRYIVQNAKTRTSSMYSLYLGFQMDRIPSSKAGHGSDGMVE